MFGIFLALTSSLFTEISTIIGKKEIENHTESVEAMGFLTYFWTMIWYLSIVLYKGGFVFSLASLPTFIVRTILEIILAHTVLYAVTRSDRSTFSFIRVGTIPLLLIIDLVLGYSFDIKKIIGIGCILFSLLFVFTRKEINKKGIGLLIITVFMAATTISLYKYNISHFNSVETEQFFITYILLIYFSSRIVIKDRVNPLRFLVHYPFSVQSMVRGIAGVCAGFAYQFAPASIITSVDRSGGIFWSIISGGVFFKERHIIIKFLVLMFLVTGIVLLI